MKHLYSNRCHDEAEVWCNAHHGTWDEEPAGSPVHAECITCLSAVMSFSVLAQVQIRKLKDIENGQHCEVCGAEGEGEYACPAFTGYG